MIHECPLDDQTLFYGVPDGTPKGVQVSTSVWLTESVDRVSLTRICNFAVPLQKAATFPKLLENVPGAAPPGLRETHAYLDFASDKRCFLSILAEKERARTNGTSITQLMETSSERNFFEMSHHRVPVHREFVSRFCSRTRENVYAALKEVGRFLDIDPTFEASDESIVRTVQTLEALLH
ncbi:hypothetical protein BDV36DRAFT_292508 [Aspergillus pseudocaelatus]|uniref:Uncharacterized protein n=1 Tax=Aspergillus pseudocaelatus TaxID=1825620 RepID=A0ABQ6WW86_9EURO|nr:hypothetical protein BDV36DRAFT_292508 [Aspergillus pseudocaelatus]